MSDDLNQKLHACIALMTLRRLLNESIAHVPLFDMSPEQEAKFKKDHPGALAVVGDFEIRCLNPEKYNL